MSLTWFRTEPVFLLVSAVALACKAPSKREHISPSQSSQGPLREDPQKLASALATWHSRLTDFPKLPQCEPTLSKPEAQYCTSTQDAWIELKRTLSNEPRDDLLVLKHSATLALTAQRAVESLRSAVLSTLAREKVRNRATKPGLHTDLPEMKTLEGYSALVQAALGIFAAFLEQGVQPLRTQAIQHATELIDQHPTWPKLRQTLEEARVFERDPSLSFKLNQLIERLQPSPKPHPATPTLP